MDRGAKVEGGWTCEWWLHPGRSVSPHFLTPRGLEEACRDGLSCRVLIRLVQCVQFQGNFFFSSFFLASFFSLNKTVGIQKGKACEHNIAVCTVTAQSTPGFQSRLASQAANRSLVTDLRCRRSRLVPEAPWNFKSRGYGTHLRGSKEAVSPTALPLGRLRYVRCFLGSEASTLSIEAQRLSQDERSMRWGDRRRHFASRVLFVDHDGWVGGMELVRAEVASN